ncbi:MAG: protein-disulfide reductase DsbD family protein [Hyphomicrobiaceae bacterium]|nr:protein-disulfide reductase DsbD family protein [Hyphomicrobiaceae bacterium]
MAVCLLACGATAGRAADGAGQATAWATLHEGTRVRLVAAGSGKVKAAVEVQLAPGWKTYWRMPGDAGVPPQFDWQGSDNAARIEVLYPAPHRLIEPAAETIGYKGSVVFPVEAVAKDGAKPIAMKLELEIGICKEICVPAQATLALEVPAAGTGALPDGVAAALASVPKPVEAADGKAPALVKVEALLAGAEPRLVIDARFPGDAAGADVFIEASDGIYVPMTKRLGPTPDGAQRFESRLSADTAKDLKGRPITLTLVGAEGATEARWAVP